jgi:hypothetical protein
MRMGYFFKVNDTLTLCYDADDFRPENCALFRHCCVHRMLCDTRQHHIFPVQETDATCKDADESSRQHVSSYSRPASRHFATGTVWHHLSVALSLMTMKFDNELIYGSRAL